MLVTTVLSWHWFCRKYNILLYSSAAAAGGSTRNCSRRRGIVARTRASSYRNAIRVPASMRRGPESTSWGGQGHSAVRATTICFSRSRMQAKGNTYIVSYHDRPRMTPRIVPPVMARTPQSCSSWYCREKGVPCPSGPALVCSSWRRGPACGGRWGITRSFFKKSVNNVVGSPSELRRSRDLGRRVLNSISCLLLKGPVHAAPNRNER